MPFISKLLYTAPLPARKPNQSSRIIRPIPYSAEELKKLYRYDATNGKLYYRVYRGPNGRVGQEVGSVTPQGFRSVMIQGKFFVLHRIIWLMQTGKAATSAIWHRNGDLSDNRIENLVQMLSQPVK